MKERLLLIFMFIINVNFIYSKNDKPTLSLRIIYPYTESITNDYEDDIVSISFNITEIFLAVKIYNRTNERISIEWENFRIDDCAIAFDTDRRIKMDEPKADEVVFPKSYSTHTYITPKKAVSDSYIGDWWSIDRIRKMGEQFSKIIIPIKISNKNKDYVFQVGVACITDGVRTTVNIPTKEKIDLIHEGMKYIDVIDLIGYPFYYTQNEKTFTAHYFNGLLIEFRTPLKVHAELLSNFGSSSSINIGALGRNKTKVTKVDTSHIHKLSPEQYYNELYK